MDSKQNKILIFSSIFVFFIVIISFTYAYFNLTITGNDTASSIMITTGTLELSFTDGTAISVGNVYPGNSFTKTFSIENTGDLNATFSIKLDSLVNTFTDDELVVTTSCVSYDVSTNAVSGTCTSYSTMVVPTTSSATLYSNITIVPNKKYSYSMVFEFIETSSAQNYNQGATFSAIVQVE